MAMKTLSIFGATGSIGRSAADVIDLNKERFLVDTVAASSNAEALAEIALRLNARHAVVADDAAYQRLKACLSGTGISAAGGQQALCDAAIRPVDIALNAIVGAAGLETTLNILKNGRRLALANKESLVVAGELVMKTAREYGAEILPVDSEHSGLFLLLDGRDINALEAVSLTASGGPFRDWPLSALANATPQEACRHPVWAMGQKISVDSATLMNKGLELIEAHHLFALRPEQLKVLVHPQSVVHAIAHWCDGQCTLHGARPDMRLALGMAFDYPTPAQSGVPRLDWAHMGSMTFEEPDRNRFQCLRLAEQALAEGGSMPAILNAANEVAVESFLSNRCEFLNIATVVEHTLSSALQKLPRIAPQDLQNARFIDHEARQIAQNYVELMQKRAS